jgi:hypothetical protein
MAQFGKGSGREKRATQCLQGSVHSFHERRRGNVILFIEYFVVDK